MRRILFCLMPAFLLSCDLFVPPKVDCDKITIVAAGGFQEPAQNRGCAVFMDVVGTYTHVLTTSEKTDPTSTASDSQPLSEALTKMKVELVGESGIYLNSGDTKAFVEVLKTKQLSELPQTLEVSTDARAALTYTIGTEVSMVLGGGSDFTGEYTAVTEHYGSGNSCPMTITYNIKCAQFVASGQ